MDLDSFSPVTSINLAVDSHSSSPLVIRIPLRQVESIYGPDGLDCATDDLLLALSQITGQVNPNCIVEVDASPRDMAYHELILEVSGLSPNAGAQLQRKLREMQLDSPRP